MDHFDILMLDSGVGGLSILKELANKRPDLSTCYLADLAHVPYGEKSESWLVERLGALIERLLPQIKPQAIVIACNTASTAVLPALRARFPIPFVGVVPAIKPAGEKSVNKCIGLLATPMTIARPYVKDLHQQFAADCKMIAIGSTELVEMAEKKIRGLPFYSRDILRICADFINPVGGLKPDTIVLGCTHFPHLNEELKLLLGRDVLWLDSGAAIAERISFLLSDSVTETAHKGFLSTKHLDQALEDYLRKNDFTVCETVLL